MSHEQLGGPESTETRKTTQEQLCQRLRTYLLDTDTDGKNSLVGRLREQEGDNFSKIDDLTDVKSVTGNHATLGPEIDAHVASLSESDQNLLLDALKKAQ